MLLAAAGCAEDNTTAPTQPVDGDRDAGGPAPDVDPDAPGTEDADADVVPEGLVRVDRGSYTAGSPVSEPGRTADEVEHRVTVSRAFYIGIHEVTQDEWALTMGDNPSGYRACGGSCPVEKVSWFDAVAYANALSEAEGLAPCYLEPQFSQTYTREDAVAERTPLWPDGAACTGYRLPTEGEWGLAARAGSVTAFHGGEITNTECDDPVMDGVGWYCGNSDDLTHPVGEKSPNNWGLYDVHGNVWEWVWDGLEDYSAQPVTDPIGPESANVRVQRGGAWSFTAKFCRAATRTGVYPGERAPDVGFRVARTIFCE
jgi:formylglycine-generating enzyme required for sulfatase activity